MNKEKRLTDAELEKLSGGRDEPEAEPARELWYFDIRAKELRDCMQKCQKDH